MIDKVTTVPRGKIGHRLGRVDAATMRAIRQALRMFLGID
jgi:mRNA-degrading endonuclease toxin of MazEF toxin-antitoxin module